MNKITNLSQLVIIEYKVILISHRYL